MRLSTAVCFFAALAVVVLAQEVPAVVPVDPAQQWYDNSPEVRYCTALTQAAKNQINKDIPESVAFAPWGDSKDLSYYLMVCFWVLFIPKALVGFFNVIGTAFASAGKPRTVLRSLEFVVDFAMGATVVIYSMVWHGVGAGGAKSNVSTLTILTIALFEVLTAYSATIYTATAIDDKFTKVLILFNRTIQGVLILTLPMNDSGNTSLYPTLAGMFLILSAFHLTHADHLVIHTPETAENRSFARRVLEIGNTSIAYIYVCITSVLLVLYGASTTYAPSYALTQWGDQPGAVLLLFVWALQALIFVSISIRGMLHKSEWFRNWLPDYVENAFNYGAIKPKKLRQSSTV